MHSKYGPAAESAFANWLMIHRSAARSYRTIGSPSLVVSHALPTPLKTALSAIGPSSGVPVLFHTASEVLTISTMWLGPTAAFVSGGALWTSKAPWGPLNPCPTPRKLVPAVGVAFFAGALCCRAP